MAHAVVLYGSHARGDHDELSDLDVLVVGEHEGQKEMFAKVPVGASISAYSWEELAAMRAYGSLFLHHLARESRVLDGDTAGLRRFAEITAAVPKYSRGQRDVRSFDAALQDCEDSMRHCGGRAEFELACIATVARHASIVGCAVTGEPEFGRYSSVAAFCARRSVPMTISNEFPELYEYKRRWRTGLKNSDDPYGSDPTLDKWLPRVRTLVAEVAKCV